MARPRKPTALLELSGAFNKDPKRRIGRIGEPQPASTLGRPPMDLPADVRACWNEIVRIAAPGVLRSSDRIAVRSAARLMAKENRDEITVGERAQLHRLLGELGLTPRSRAYIHVDPTPEHNEFAAS